MFPPLVTIYNTNHCQHACAHCFLTVSRMLNKGEMRFDHFVSLVNSLRGRGVFIISLSGGDPFLHPRAYDMIRAIDEAGFKPFIACNPSPEIEFNRLLRMNVTSLQFSLDRVDADAHDVVRGVGSFRSTCAMIAAAIRHGIKVNLSVCLHAGNFDEVAEFISLARRLEIFRLKFVFLKGFLGAPPAPSLTLHEEARGQVRDLLVRLDGEASIAEWVVLSGFDIRRARPLTPRWLDVSIAVDGDVLVGPESRRMFNCFHDSDWIEKYDDACRQSALATDDGVCVAKRARSLK